MHAGLADAYWQVAGSSSPTRIRATFSPVGATTCRNSHASRADSLSFATSEQFAANAALIERSLCVVRDMPNAQVPLQHLWSGPARAYVAAYLDIATCSPNSR